MMHAIAAAVAGGRRRGFSNLVALLHFDGANGSTTITDSSQAAKTYTVAGNAAISTAQSISGGSSLALDGSGDWAQTTAGLSDFAFGAGDFTVATWYKHVGAPANPVLVDFYRTATAGSWQLAIGYTAANKAQWIVSTVGATVVASSSTTVTDGAWHHIAVTRAGGTLRLFVDGVVEATVTDATTYSGTSVTTFAVGAQVTSRNSAYDTNGYIDEVVVAKGYAFWTAAFTPPTRFPDS